MLLNLTSFAKLSKSESEALLQLVTELESLSNLAHEDDLSNHALYTVLWSSKEGHDLALIAQSKRGIDDVFSKAVEELMDSIRKYESHSTHHVTSRIVRIFTRNVTRSSSSE